jgi:hypothetical protein
MGMVEKRETDDPVVNRAPLTQLITIPNYRDSQSSVTENDYLNFFIFESSRVLFSVQKPVVLTEDFVDVLSSLRIMLELIA